MAELPHSWAAYGRLQTRLSRLSGLDDHSWGLEAGLNVILEPDFSPQHTDEAEFRRAAASGARKERDHLQRFHSPSDDECDPLDVRCLLTQIMARQALRQLEAEIDVDDDLALLVHLAQGEGYCGAAELLKQPESSLRSRMMRLRRRFGHLRPE